MWLKWFNPLPHVPIGSSNSAANKDMMSKVWTNGDTVLSDNNTCFSCNIAITNFLVLNTCEIRFHDFIDHSAHIYIITSF